MKNNIKSSHNINSEASKQVDHSSSSHEAHDPLAQFEVKKIFDIELFGYDLSFTNSSLYMIIATLIAVIFLHVATRKKAIIPSKLQVVAESLYNFVHNMISGSIGKEGEKFFALIFSLFFFILLCNVLGLTPYSFTATSQIVVTLTLSLIAFLTVVIFAIARNGIGGFFHMFLPSGVPIFMAPIIFVIELFSFLIRPVTLSVRLFANMVAGHVLLKVVAGFILIMGAAVGIFPFLFSVIMTAFELFVAVLQAYIFATLVCAYLADVTKAH